MSVATDTAGGAGHSTAEPSSPSIGGETSGTLSLKERMLTIVGLSTMVAESENPLQSLKQVLNSMAGNGVEVDLETEEVHRMGQMGARRIGSLALGIAIIGLVMNELSSTETFSNSTGVIDVNGIFQTAGSGLQILAIGIIIAAASVLLGLWQGF
jgi:hypothetical protein